MKTYKTLEEVNIAIGALEDAGVPVPDWMARQKEEFLKAKSSDTPIYDTLLANYPFKPMDPLKKQCIEDTVRQLLEDGPNAEEPGLLLGKIQCGKTDTFEDIIGLAFDKGIDIAVVFTKGTKPLTNQTIMRMKKDYRFFDEDYPNGPHPVICIYDIMNIKKRGLSKGEIQGKKIVIVCKKQAVNLDHLMALFIEKSPHLKQCKVLVVDDEADFASRNYKSVKLKPLTDADGNPIPVGKETEMAVISQQIDDFRKIPDYCRYLQVTATPYCLFLQPNGELFLNGTTAMSFKPRFTTLVPIHPKYIGGKQYYEDSKEEDSMYWHLYHPVDDKCVNVLGHEDQRYLNASIASGNIYGLTYSILAYLCATAVRRIQIGGGDDCKYRSSALFHVEIDKDNHEWQYKLIKRIINDISKYIVDEDHTDARIARALQDIYEDFCMSNQKGRTKEGISAEMPELEAIVSETRKILHDNLSVNIVNSDNAVEEMLDDKTGELRLSHWANIFIGGNILDRGITIKNMLCFFYGRNPKNFQQDTVLQHARMYGARDKEDMAVTRFHTTNTIYKILVRMNELDNQLRQWFLDGRDKEEPNAIFVGFDKNIKPCATSKIKIAQTMTIKKQQRCVPSGFWTGPKTKIAKTIEKIESLIENSPNYFLRDEDGFFEIDKSLVKEILSLIESTYIYDDKHNNLDHKEDLKELMCMLEYCTSKSGDKLWALHRKDRNATRIRQNGAWIDAPDDGRTDLAPARQIAKDRPVIMFIKEKGESRINAFGENIGWNDTPFYWPVFISQENLDSAMYAFNSKAKEDDIALDVDSMIAGIPSGEILKLTLGFPFVDDNGKLVFGEIGKDTTEEYKTEEYRSIRTTNAGTYLEKDDNGNFLLADGVEIDEANWAGVNSLNGGYFPFILRPYKYLLLRNGYQAKSDVMLLELKDVREWSVYYDDRVTDDGRLEVDNSVVAGDTLTDRQLNKNKVEGNNLCVWIVGIGVKRILAFKSLKYKQNPTTGLWEKE